MGPSAKRILCLNESQFFRAGKAFDGRLSPERGGFVWARLLVDQDNRPSPSSIFRALPRVVRLDATLQMIGDAGIQGSIPALKDIDPVQSISSFRWAAALS